MNRRRFLSAVAAAVAGSTLDPERLLWTAGKKLISIPAPPKVYYQDVLTEFLRGWVQRVYDEGAAFQEMIRRTGGTSQEMIGSRARALRPLTATAAQLLSQAQRRER